MTGDEGTGGRTVRVDLAKFEWLCVKTKSSRKQVHTVDISEAVYGASAPFDKLPRKIWAMVDDILDDCLMTSGYSTRIDGNRIFLLFPKLSRSLGEMKAKMIAGEIRLGAQKLLNIREPALEQPPSPSIEQPKPTQSPKPSAAILTKEEEEHRRQSNLVFEAMASRLEASRISDDDVKIPAGFKLDFVPTWNVENSMVVGYCAELLSSIEGTIFLRPVTHEEQERLDLAVLSAAVQMMNDCVEADKLLTITVPVQWATLDLRSSRTKFLELANGIKEAGRSLMVLSVEAVPEDLLPSRVGDRLQQFAPYFRLFSLSLRLGRKDFLQVSNLPTVKMLNVNLGKEPWEDKVHLAELNQLMEAINFFRKPMHVSNVSTKSQLLAALSAGARRISGRVIPNSGKIEMRRLTLTDLYLGHAIRREAAKGTK
jgi:hypothetical protein